MAIHVLLLGRTPFDEVAVEAEIAQPDVRLSTGTNQEDVERAFAQGPVDVVIMGAGLPLSDRLAIVEQVFERSDTTTVHMKDRASGRTGMLPFVKSVLSAVTTHLE